MTVKVADANWCPECCTVTADSYCPHCEKRAKAHPERRKKEGYCVDCAEPFSSAELLVRTYEDDPYMQTDDGMLITSCKRCQAFDDARNGDDEAYQFVAEKGCRVSCPHCAGELLNTDLDEDAQWYYCGSCGKVSKPTPF